MGRESGPLISDSVIHCSTFTLTLYRYCVVELAVLLKCYLGLLLEGRKKQVIGVRDRIISSNLVKLEVIGVRDKIISSNLLETIVYYFVPA